MSYGGRGSREVPSRRFRYVATATLALSLACAAVWAWSLLIRPEFDFWIGGTRCGLLFWQWGVTFGVWPHSTSRPNGMVDSIWIPYAAPLAACALPSVVRLVMWLKRRSKARAARAKRVCRHCGYDLRASPRQCPECGAQLWPLMAAMGPAEPGLDPLDPGEAPPRPPVG